MAFPETLENAWDNSWTGSDIGTWSFVSGGLHGSSNYCLRMPSSSWGYAYIEPAGGGAVGHLACWFDVSTDGLADAGVCRFAQLGTATNGYTSIALQLVKSGAQLTVRCMYNDNYSDYYTAAENISAGTKYHSGLSYNATTEVWAWYLSTTEDLGAAKAGGTGAGLSRNPAQIRIGYMTGGGGTSVIDIDSIDFSTSTLVHNAEDGAAASGQPFAKRWGGIPFAGAGARGRW
jgi:hypothetical protein